MHVGYCTGASVGCLGEGSTGGTGYIERHEASMIVKSLSTHNNSNGNTEAHKRTLHTWLSRC